MPSAKSARVQVRKRGRNIPLRTRAKTEVRKARALIDANDIDSAEKAVQSAFVALDKAAQKGALHANNASRRKSRIMKALQKAKNAS
ncbi:MAG: 30S ribosomal protein S20 [Chloroflexi bacterium]|nr:30S ribosomal protein S20 [Chloroflexota bacterium]